MFYFLFYTIEVA